MFSCLRLTRLLLCVVIASPTLLAQDRKDRDAYGGSYRDSDRHSDRDDRHSDQDSDRHSDRECDRNHPRTSALDYLLLPGFPGTRASLPVALEPTDLGQVLAMPFHLDRFFRVGHISISITTALGGGHAYVGIYDSHGNLMVQGKLPTDELGDLTVAVSPRVLLKPGMYYFAIGGDENGAAAAGYLFDEGPLNFIHSGLATNHIVDGSMPATLGPISLGQEGSTPTAVFTP
jgi:hypothetical protein